MIVASINGIIKYQDLDLGFYGFVQVKTVDLQIKKQLLSLYVTLSCVYVWNPWYMYSCQVYVHWIKYYMMVILPVFL